MHFTRYYNILLIVTFFMINVTYNIFAFEHLTCNSNIDSVITSQRDSEGSFISKGVIKLYQNIISSQYYSGCVFETSCSNFAIEGLEHRNTLEALFLAADRIQRCHSLAPLYYNNKYKYDEKVSDPIRSYHFGIKRNTDVNKYYISDTIKDNTNTPFADYLLNSADYLQAVSEYEKQNKSIPNDFLNYKIGICYKNTSQLELAADYFLNILSSSTESETTMLAALHLGHTLYLKNEFTNSLMILRNMPEIKEPNLLNEKLILTSLNYFSIKEWENCAVFLDNNKANFKFATTYNNLLHYCERGQQIKSKNATVSSLLSAIVPGAGKTYCGKLFDGLNSFFLVGFSSLFTYSYYKRQGLTPLTVLYSLTSLILYSGNIYGSYISAKYYRNIEEDKLLNEIQINIRLHLLL